LASSVISTEGVALATSSGSATDAEVADAGEAAAAAVAAAETVAADGAPSATLPADMARLSVDPLRLRLDKELALDKDAELRVRLRAISFRVLGGCW
jgi:hypothetical protein